MLVYAFMNGAIFQFFGVSILIFELVMVLMFALSLPRLAMSSRHMFEGQILFLGFLLLSTLIAVGLIHLHRWAAVTASALGLVWAFVLASSLGYQPWTASLIGMPVIFGMLLPLYATVKNWSRLKAVGNLSLRSSFDALRSSDQLHLE